MNFLVARRQIDVETVGTVVVVGPAGAVASWPLLTECVDLAVVDRVARLHLDARRMGLRAVLRDVSPALADLLRLAGLADVLQVVR